MNRSPESRTGVAALRPWPFGPPLRGRAPRRDAGPLAAPGRSTPPSRGKSTASPARPQALAPAGGLACHQPTRCAQ
jgi:hypothetical protein